MLFSVYGIWNLDFFRTFYSDLCLRIGILPTLALDFTIAVYPLLLIILSYLLIVLHDRNCRAVMILSKPFRILFSFFRRNWKVKTSVIDAFSTFFFLSNVKFLSVSFDLLLPTRIYHLHGDHYNSTLGLYYAADIQYFGSEHLPYAILAIVLLCLFVLLPATLLALYPFKFFQKLLNTFPVRWHILLCTFVDSFHGCYKDGTEPGTRDLRWFVSTFFLFHLCYCALGLSANTGLQVALSGILALLQITLLIILQPFKLSLKHYNNIHILILMLQAFAALLYSLQSIAAQHLHFIWIMIAITPVFFGAVSALHWVYAHRKFGLDLFHRLKGSITGYVPLATQHASGNPDRMENPDRYPRQNLTHFTRNNY